MLEEMDDDSVISHSRLDAASVVGSLLSAIIKNERSGSKLLELASQKIDNFIDLIIEDGGRTVVNGKTTHAINYTLGRIIDTGNVDHFKFFESEFPTLDSRYSLLFHKMLFVNPFKWQDILKQNENVWLSDFSLNYEYWIDLSEASDWFYNQDSMYNAVMYIFKNFEHNKEDKLYLIKEAIKSKGALKLVETLQDARIPLSFENSFLVKNTPNTKKTILNILATDTKNIDALVSKGLNQYLPKEVQELFLF